MQQSPSLASAAGRLSLPLRQALGIALILAGVLVLAGARYRRSLLAFAAAGVVFQIVTLAQPFPAISLALVLALVAWLWPGASDGAELGEQVTGASAET